MRKRWRACVNYCSSILAIPPPQPGSHLIERGLRGAELVNFLCFHLDVPAIEKQTLLEARGARLDCLFDVLTFKLEERKLGGPGPHGGHGSVQ